MRNENDGPWLTNLQAPLDPADYPVYFEAQGFRLRSQHAALLVGTDERLSLEEVVQPQAQLPDAAGRSRQERPAGWDPPRA